MKATVTAPANIALIKHWGTKYDEVLEMAVPLTSSLSFNLNSCLTTTTATWTDKTTEVHLMVKDQHSEKMVEIRRRDGVERIVDFIRSKTGINWGVHIESENTFPANAGIASSASGFSALSGALYHALPLELQSKLPSLANLCARSGSFSAPRSLESGFTRLDFDGKNIEINSLEIHPKLKLVDIVVLVDTSTKHEPSGVGQSKAHTSPLQAGRLAETQNQIEIMSQALMTGDLKTILHLTELNSLMLHSVMLTQTPSHQYFTHKTWELIESLNAQGVSDWAWTLDAGANPHIITTEVQTKLIEDWLNKQNYSYLVNRPGDGLRVIEKE